MPQVDANREHAARRISRWVAPFLVIAAILLAIGAFYVVENWRGELAWRRTKASLEAKGEILDYRHYLPTPPRDEFNMMKVPGMAETFIKGQQPALMISAAPPKITQSTNLIRFGEIAFTTNAAEAIASVETLRTNASARRDLSRAFVGRGFEAPVGLYLSERRPGSEVKRVLIEGSTGAAELKKGTFLKPAQDKVDAIGEGRFAILLEPGRCFGAEEYLAWSAGQSNLFAMLDEAAKRPECWLPGDYSIPFSWPTPNYVTIRGVAHLLGGRAQAFLLLNRPDEAFAELGRMDTLNRIVTAKPMTLVAAMIHVAVTGVQTSVIADGFAVGGWKEQHWRGFIESHAKRELMPPVIESLRSGERAGILHLVEQLSGDEADKAAQDTTTKSLAEMFRMVPRGWARQNMVVYATAVQEQIEMFDAMGPVDPQEAQVVSDALLEKVESRLPTRRVASVGVANVLRAGQTTLKNQTLMDQVVIAAALELYRAEAGKYPDRLDELSPKFLMRVPTDVILGKPLRYQKRPNGEYALYSIGWNAKDDIGALLADASAPMLEIFESGPATNDWIWKGVPERRIKE